MDVLAPTARTLLFGYCLASIIRVCNIDQGLANCADFLHSFSPFHNFPVFFFFFFFFGGGGLFVCFFKSNWNPGYLFNMTFMLNPVTMARLRNMRSWDRLIFMMGIPIPVRGRLYIETPPDFHRSMCMITLIYWWYYIHLQNTYVVYIYIYIYI